MSSTPVITSTTIIALRHGQSTWNKERRWQGQAATPPLTEFGERQALEAAKKLTTESIDAVVTSHLKRAQQTGAIIAEHLGIKQVDIIDDLQERNVGKYQGLTRDEISELSGGRSVEQARRDGEVPVAGWERDEDLANRMKWSFLEVGRRYPNKRVVVISHGGSLMQLCRSLGLNSTRFSNLSGRIFQVENYSNEIFIDEIFTTPIINDEDTTKSLESASNTNSKESTIL